MDKPERHLHQFVETMKSVLNLNDEIDKDEDKFMHLFQKQVDNTFVSRQEAMYAEDRNLKARRAPVLPGQDYIHYGIKLPQDNVMHTEYMELLCYTAMRVGCTPRRLQYVVGAMENSLELAQIQLNSAILNDQFL